MGNTKTAQTRCAAPGISPSLTLFLLLILFSIPLDAQQRPDAPPYARRGEYTVGTRDAISQDEQRPLNITLWYPALNPDNQPERVTYRHGLFSAEGRALRDAAPNLSSAPYPLVIFSHGNSGFRFQSLYLTEHLASQGFVVIALDHPTNTVFDAMQDNNALLDNIAPNYAHRPADVLRVIAYADSLDAGDLAGLIDTQRIAIVGHSFGGYTALAVGGLQLNFDQLEQQCLAAVEPFSDVCFLVDEEPRIAEARGFETIPEGAWPPITDPRIKAIVALAPWNGSIFDLNSLTYIQTPTMFLVGSADDVTPPIRDAEYMYDRMFAATPKVLITFQNGGHYIFVDSCSDLLVQFGFFEVCSDPVWDVDRTNDLTNHFTTAFLRSVLYDEPEASAALQPGAVNLIGISYQIATDRVQTLVPAVISERPHDPNSFIQGLLLYEDKFYESAGQYGESNLRQVDPQTGEILNQVNLNAQFFAEGLARVDDTLIQLTWREGVAIVFDINTFEVINIFQYTGEGWGLCYDGEHLYMSDGSSTLFIRDPLTFDLVGQIPVTMRGEPVVRLNELECVGNSIYANIWQTDYIVEIEKATGRVIARIDASDLLTPEERAALTSGAVLNGIAYDPENAVFFITGKLWNKLFEVRFVEP